MSLSKSLRTVKQVPVDRPAFTPGGLRWLIFNAEENGFDSAIVRVGGRVLIDLDRFDEWLEERRGR